MYGYARFRACSLTRPRRRYQMKSPTRFMTVLVSCIFLLALAGVSVGQGPEIVPGSMNPGYTRRTPVIVDPSQPPQLTIDSSIVLDATTGALVGFAGGGQGGNGGNAGTSGVASTGATIDGLDTVPTFDGAFFAQAGPNSTGLRLFRFSMMGNDPRAGGVTSIPALIDEVSLQLLNADGSTFKT